MKVLHLPSSVGGQAWGLAQGERALGLDARVLLLYDNYIHYPSDYHRHLEQRNLLGRMAGHLSAFLEFRTGYDVYHFNYGSSLVHFLNRGMLLWDLPFYPTSARKVFTFNGCDARQKLPTMERNCHHRMAACFADDCYGGICADGELDRQKRLAIEKADRYASHFFAMNPDLLYFLPREKTIFLPYTVSNFQAIQPKPLPFLRDGIVRIVHAPTDRGAKGSALILAALQKLQEEFGNRLKIILVEGVSHEQALALYSQADLFLDQVLVGWYGGVAVEVMKMGIPVATFINDDHLDKIPTAMQAELPMIRVTPFNLASCLRPFLQEPEQLREIGKRSQAFVERWHHPEWVATITRAAYQGAGMVELAAISPLDKIVLSS